MIGRDPGIWRMVDPARWLDRLSSVAADDPAAALGEIAERVHELLPVDVVAVEMIDETGAEPAIRGYRVGTSAGAQALAPLIPATGPDPLGLADAALAAGAPVEWPRILGEDAALARLAAIADAGGPAGAVHRLLGAAAGLAVPLWSPRGALGAITLVSLSPDAPIPDGAVDALGDLAPQIALTALNRQLAARNRRTRQTLDGVISSSRMGVIVTDVHGHLSLANRAAEEILGIALAPLVGRPTRRVVAEQVKWRFTNPEDFAARLMEAHDQPAEESVIEAETVEGRSVEHISSPVRDHDGRIVGRVDMLNDVTTARNALTEARRLAAERAALLEREERRSQEEVALSRAAHELASAITAQEIHAHLLDQARALCPDCEKSAVFGIDPRGAVVPVMTRGFAESTVQKMTFTLGEGTVGRALLAGRAFICNDTALDDRLSTRITGPEDIRSFMLVPLVHGGRVLGMVSLNCLSPREFGEREVRVLRELCGHAAAALRNALQFERERHIAETLQQALIADELPRVPGLELAAIYQPAAGSLVGGDFYAAWRLLDGRLAVLVGDVSGKGVEAAGVTAMVRHMAEALSHHQPEPAALVGELNDLLCPRVDDGSLVTLVLAVVDTAADELAWCSAGHPPAILIRAGGDQRALEDPGPPLGVFAGQRYHQRVEPFLPGDTLVLYTDGLIEARRQGREFGEAGVRQSLNGSRARPPAELARTVHAAARAWCGGQLSDDVAVAVVRRTA